jgi:hypothetical protein
MTLKLQDLQGDHIIAQDIAGQATAATVDEFVIGRVPFRATVIGVQFIPKAAITGTATNFFTASLRNRGAAGAGTAQIAARAYSNGNNAVAFAPDALTLTPANVDVNAGDVLTLEKLVTGAGLAMPAGAISVTLRAR